MTRPAWKLLDVLCEFGGEAVDRDANALFGRTPEQLRATAVPLLGAGLVEIDQESEGTGFTVKVRSDGFLARARQRDELG